MEIKGRTKPFDMEGGSAENGNRKMSLHRRSQITNKGSKS